MQFQKGKLYSMTYLAKCCLKKKVIENTLFSWYPFSFSNCSRGYFNKGWDNMPLYTIGVIIKNEKNLRYNLGEFERNSLFSWKDKS